MASRGAFPVHVRAEIKARADGWCERCGLPVSTGAQIHHRRPRGMGGSSDPAAATAENGLYVHRHCHAEVESNRALAIAQGWLVPQGKDPASVPVYRRAKWVFLTPEAKVLGVDRLSASRLDQQVREVRERPRARGVSVGRT